MSYTNVPSVRAMVRLPPLYHFDRIVNIPMALNILGVAKRVLSSADTPTYDTSYICCAIDYGGWTVSARGPANALKECVSAAIHPHQFLTAYAFRKDDFPTHWERQAVRHFWLDQIIAYLEKRA